MGAHRLGYKLPQVKDNMHMYFLVVVGGREEAER